MVPHDSALVVAGQGIEGDRYAAGHGKYSRSPGMRDVTIFDIATIRALKEELGIELHPHEHRRNLTTQGIANEKMVGRTFSIGEVIFEGLRPCRPCRYLNMMSKKQIYTHLMERAGLYCRVVSGGTLRVGNPINFV